MPKQFSALIKELDCFAQSNIGETVDVALDRDDGLKRRMTALTVRATLQSD